MRKAGIWIVVLLALAAPLRAQSDGAGAVGNGREAGPEWSALRVAKWGSLVLTTAAAVYGVSTNLHADRLYLDLERACLAEPEVCLLRGREGNYLDAELEARYQAIRSSDRRARNALLGSQIGVAATVALFLLDLRNARPPADIPYQPPGRLKLSPRPDGAIQLRLSFPSR